MAPILERVLTLRTVFARDKAHQPKCTKDAAERLTAPAVSGSLKSVDEESLVDAELIPGGSDWSDIDLSTGIVQLDVRLAFRDEDGDVFYVKYQGIVRLDGPTELNLKCPVERTKKDHYLFISPTFEVTGPEYKWMEQCAFVGEGHLHISGDGTLGVEYEVYKLIPG